MTYRRIAMAVALSLAPVAALADFNYMVVDSVQDVQSTVEIDLVRAESDGIVAVYQMRAGEPTTLIGTARVNAGANSDVRVQLSGARGTQVLVALHAGTDATGPMLDSAIIDRD